MTEAEWLAATDPPSMLRALRRAGSDRKARLLMVAACRRGEYLLDEPEYLALLGAVERVAEGELSPASLARYRTNCPPVQFGEQQLWEEDSEELNQSNLIKHAVWLSGGSNLRYLEACLLEAAQGLRRRPAIHEELRDQCRLIYDIFGNPFRPVPFSPEWRTETAVALAAQMYESRDFSAMPILADALQDAGCENGDILDHCRGPGPHVRGCWVVDLILGKS
jgi:hypothetical protein